LSSSEESEKDEGREEESEDDFDVTKRDTIPDEGGEEESEDDFDVTKRDTIPDDDEEEDEDISYVINQDRYIITNYGAGKTFITDICFEDENGGLRMKDYTPKDIELLMKISSKRVKKWMAHSATKVYTEVNRFPILSELC
jgi:hypothetical protein